MMGRTIGDLAGGGRGLRSRPGTAGIVERLRSSFAARLLGALLGLVILVAGTMLAFVHSQTDEQVRLVTARSADIAGRAFAEVEELHRAQLARLGRAFTDSRRTLAALEAALESGEQEWLVETARYELELARAGSSLIAFTDSDGRVVATLIDGQPAQGDPAGIARLARAPLESGPAVVVQYRVVGGRLFTVFTERVVLGGRPIGTITFGLPVDGQVARHLADAAGADVCFVAGSRCIAGTVENASPLGQRLAAVTPGSDATFTDGGRRWVLHAEPVTGEAAQVRRVIAVPVDDALLPFERIRRALLLTGLAALAVALAIGAVLSQRLAEPVRELVAATRRIARGELDARVQIRGRDELAGLGRSFNEMAEGLALKERYRDVLKKVVSREIAEDLLAGGLALGGEVRDVTVLFADIVGFTTFAARTDPHAVIGALNEFMTVWSRIIEEEGGVIDKYLGDGVMAVFGAPAAQADDPGRAVRAAIRMQEATDRLNAERLARGLDGMRQSIGIATGPAVAGNVGSPDRLNYTVIGDTVNLASRLCDAAGPGEILVSSGTERATRDVTRFVYAGDHVLRGMPEPVAMFAVDRRGLDRGAKPLAHAMAVGVLALAMAVAPAGANAQDRAPGLPTLSDLGLSWISRSGSFQVDLGGQLDIEGYVPQSSPAWLIPDVDPFVAGRLRLFTDVFAGDHVYGLIELRADRGETPASGDVDARIEQAFIRVAAVPAIGMNVQFGKFALPFGGYAARHHTIEDPLIRPPLAYDYPTVVSSTVVPGATAGFLDWKHEGTTRRSNGAPQIWNVPYPWGGLVSARTGAIALHAGVLSASPSSSPEQWSFDADRLRDPSIVVGAAWQIVPELRVSAAYDRGPYIHRVETGALPAGTRPEDFVQEIWNAEVVFERGRTTLRGEAFIDRWEVPNIERDPRDISWYLESRYRLSAGLHLSARWSEIRFNELEAGTVREAWDHRVRRLQIGAGYRILHNTGVRIEASVNRTHGPDPRDDLLAVQWWWAF